MKRIKKILTSPFHCLFPISPSVENLSARVKLQKRCVELNRREEDLVNAHVTAVAKPELKELFLCKARGTIFKRPGSITHAVYH